MSVGGETRVGAGATRRATDLVATWNEKSTMASTTNAAAGLKRVLTLYRQILRAHRVRLPAPMRVLGDGYAREEFRRHLEAKTTREQWLEFGSEWSKYLGAIDPRGADAGAMPNLSGELAPEVVEAMTEEQRQMLQKLREEATSFGLGLETPEKDGGPKRE